MCIYVIITTIDMIIAVEVELLGVGADPQHGLSREFMFSFLVLIVIVLVYFIIYFLSFS